MGKWKSNRQDTRSDQTERETIQQLKAMNRALLKENSRLKKELNKRQDVSDDYKELLEETEVKKVHGPQEHRCPKCNAKTELLDLGKVKLDLCKNCGWRSKKK